VEDVGGLLVVVSAGVGVVVVGGGVVALPMRTIK
jgi:hypothetical protein